MVSPIIKNISFSSSIKSGLVTYFFLYFNKKKHFTVTCNNNNGEILNYQKYIINGPGTYFSTLHCSYGCAVKYSHKSFNDIYAINGKEYSKIDFFLYRAKCLTE